MLTAPKPDSTNMQSQQGCQKLLRNLRLVDRHLRRMLRIFIALGEGKKKNFMWCSSKKQS
jgi:hypothetical protein